MAPDGSERLTNRQSDRSTSTSGSPERVAQVRTHRTAPLDQSVADPSSLPASRPRDRANQRTPCASTGEFFNTIRHERSSKLIAVCTLLISRELHYVIDNLTSRFSADDVSEHLP